MSDSGAAERGNQGTTQAGAGDHQPAGERVVIRDRRRIDATGEARSRFTEGGRGERAEASGGGPAEEGAGAEAGDGTGAGSGPAGDETGTGAGSAQPAPASAGPAAADAGESTGSGADSTGASGADPGAAAPTAEAELARVRAELEERTRDLQRVSAEYANYRKRVDRDRGLVAEQATGAVLSALLAVLDDLDRAREHGDLVGPFGSVAEQLTAALAKFGLTPFGEKGDPFDPTRHEAVAHLTSPEVKEPTCVDVMRRGYSLGDRLLRAALVAVADPE